MEWHREQARRWLVQAVQVQLAPRRASFAAADSLARAAPERIGKVELRLDGLEHALAVRVARLERVGDDFAPDFTIDQVLRRHPGAAGVLASHGLPGCGGCAVSTDETLAEAAEAYGLDLAEMAEQLQGLLQQP